MAVDKRAEAKEEIIRVDLNNARKDKERKRGSSNPGVDRKVIAKGKNIDRSVLAKCQI